MLLSNETKSIRYETIDTLCAIFQCTPNELFVYVEDDMDNKI
ncbi:MAG: helix-turn-helix domain-containing protein [Anaerovoracaceae bacterium]